MKGTTRLALVALALVSLFLANLSNAAGKWRDLELTPVNRPLVGREKAPSSAEAGKDKKATATGKTRRDIELTPVNKPLAGREKK
jgi:hypothetical protein